MASTPTEDLKRAIFTRSALWLVLLTVLQLCSLFLWDAYSICWLYRQPDHRLSFRRVALGRVDTSLWNAVNVELGQGVFAWKMSDVLKIPVSASLGRYIVLGMFDFGILMFLAFIGSFLKRMERVGYLPWVCAVGVGGMILAGLILRFLPKRWKKWLEDTGWFEWLRWWGWRQSFWFGLQRFALFGFTILYAGVCLAVCGLPADPRTVMAVIPFVLLAESMPSISGLGQRGAALTYLLNPQDPSKHALLICFGLIWSLVIIVGRALIGLVGKGISSGVWTDTQRDL